MKRRFFSDVRLRRTRSSLRTRRARVHPVIHPDWIVRVFFCRLDIDECLLRNGHGPCQGSCTNTWGGYKCSCRGIPGTKLDDDGHTCDDVDECRDGTAGCSHRCINTVGSAFCVCPDGLQLDDDWKTCIDVNECSDPELQPDRCSDRGATCLNTYGSYKCT